MLGDGPLGSAPLGALADTDIVDVLALSDAISSVLSAVPLADTLAFSDTLIGNLAITSVTADTLGFSDALAAHWTATTTDTLSVSDVLASDLTAAPLVDTLAFGDTLTGNLAITSVTADTLGFRDEIGSCLMAVVVDTLGFSDVLTGVVSIVAESTDTLGFSDALSGSVAGVAPALADTLTFSDTLDGRLALVAEWVDTLGFSDTLVDTGYQVIVVTNVETGAVSTYTLAPAVSGVAAFRGKLYLAGPDGLYALDAETDDDSPVAWRIQTGFSALGTDLLKRIQDVNVMARTQGDTTLTITSARDGSRTAWPYPLPPLARSTYRDGVIKVGKGVSSVYYQLALAGAGPAEIDQLRLTVESLSRRR